jgi:hypothetical protein
MKLVDQTDALLATVFRFDLGARLSRHVNKEVIGELNFRLKNKLRESLLTNTTDFSREMCPRLKSQAK